MTCLFYSTSAIASEKINLTAEDGFKITGNLFPGKNKLGVVLLHMYRSDRKSWQPLIKYLEDRGITALAIDLRGHGDSRSSPDGEDVTKQVLARNPETFKKMHLDAEAAVRHLISRGIPSSGIGLIGASVGCSVALHTIAGGKVPVSAAVLMTPGKDYLGVPSMEHIKKWSGTPLLILSSNEELDRGAGPIFNALKSHGAVLKTFEEEDIHGTNMFGEVAGVEELIVDWLSDTLARSGKKVSEQLPLYRIELRVHLQKSSRPPKEYVPIFAEINRIWRSQANICFEIGTVDTDETSADGIDMWFSPYIGGLNGYYDGESIQMTDDPVLGKALQPSSSSAARTAAHELGHYLGLTHRQDSDDNLMRSKTYGWQLNAEEIQLARESAEDMALPDTTQADCGIPKINQ